MTKFIHAREWLDEGDLVIVNCDHQCNVLLTDDINFQNYRSHRGFNYFGGHFKILPARVQVPSTGFWNVTIDLGGSLAGFRYGIQYMKVAA
jgi:hypothetical protein